MVASFVKFELLLEQLKQINIPTGMVFEGKNTLSDLSRESGD